VQLGMGLKANSGGLGWNGNCSLGFIMSVSPCATTNDQFAALFFTR
jgi:hypothetical protein